MDFFSDLKITHDIWIEVNAPGSKNPLNTWELWANGILINFAIHDPSDGRFKVEFELATLKNRCGRISIKRLIKTLESLAVKKGLVWEHHGANGYMEFPSIDVYREPPKNPWGKAGNCA